MKVGADANKIGEILKAGAIPTLDYAHRHGLAGVFFRSVCDASPTLDLGELREVRAHADALGLYLEFGVGRINPYNTAQTPETRRLGGGDYRLGIERMIRAARAIDCVELWAVTAGFQKGLPGFLALDRYRTDVAWADQLEATAKFLGTLAPLLRDLGCRLDVESHEDITTFEILRLIDRVGADIVGITLDTGNLVWRGEDPVAAVRRAAPFVHLTHLKDVCLTFVDEGLQRQVRPCGDGILDWPILLQELARFAPDLHLSIEEHRSLNTLQVYHPVWQAGQPDLTVAELAELFRLAHQCERRIARGEMQSPADYYARPYDEAEKLACIQRGAAYLNGVVRLLGLEEKVESALSP